MPSIDPKIKNPKMEIEAVRGFLGGLNTFQDQTIIKESELTEAKNVILTVDGVEPRYGVDNYGDDASDSKVYWGGGYYQSDGTDEFLRISGARLKKYGSGTWTAVDTDAFANANAEAVQVRDSMYFFNGSDSLRVYDGTSVEVFTALTTPANLTIVPQGTGGTTTYSYRVSAFNAQGETLAVAAATTTTGNATLTTTNFNRLDWDDVTNATGYNIYGNKATGVGHTYIDTTYLEATSTYDDTGEEVPDGVSLVPEGNSTAGIKGSMACFAISRLFVAGNPDNPSRLYWSGVGSNITNFGGAPEGGGYVDVYKNDGSDIRGVIAFQGGVIVGKDNAIYKFSFTSDGYPQLEEITRSFGVISHRSMKAVENDIIFAARKDGRLGFYSLGNQENYAASVLRTNELSVKIASELENVNLDNLENAAGFYFRNIYGCAINKTGSTTNDRVWCLDTRFGAWVYWEDFNPNCFFSYVDSGQEELYFGNESSGYTTKMFQTDRNDNDAAISTEWATKSFDQDTFYLQKQYYKPTFQFKNINKTGAITGTTVVDGSNSDKTFSISDVITGGLGFGAMKFGQPRFGDATGGTPSDAEAADQIVEIYTPSTKGRSIKYEFSTATIDLRYKFLSLKHAYQVMEGKRLSQTSRVF